MGKKVLVTGDRNWTDRAAIKFYLKQLQDKGFDTLIEGEARGADTIAREEGEKLGFTIAESSPGVKGYPANWKTDDGKFNKAAGPQRNTQMLVEGKPDLVIGFHKHIFKSKGTKNMLEQVAKTEIPSYLVSGKGHIVTV
jgi:YspA, cpYpsA-related SLOG family